MCGGGGGGIRIRTMSRCSKRPREGWLNFKVRLGQILFVKTTEREGSKGRLHNDAQRIDTHLNGLNCDTQHK